MSAPENNPKFITLYTLCNGLKRYLDQRLQGNYLWVTAEISGISEKRHLYLQLVETHNGQKIASMRARMWESQLHELQRKLGNDWSNVLKQGSKALFQVEVQFHELYGLQLNIVDVDPSYSLGELERRKQETIKRLKDQGLIDRNRQLPLPVVLQKIALIASPNTAGYEDFANHLEQNPYGYRFKVDTYRASVQGDVAEHEIVTQLKAVQAFAYDAVVLLRGGGSKFDLEVFNAFSIAETIALSKLPVITGIGHETDISVADLVAFSRQKTPTAAAQFIVQTSMNFEAAVAEKSNQVMRLATHRMELEKRRINERVGHLRTLTNTAILTNREELKLFSNNLNLYQQNFIKSQKHLLERKSALFEDGAKSILAAQNRALSSQWTQLRLLLSGSFSMEHTKLSNKEKLIKLLHPNNTLQRGYSISLLKGKPLVSADQLKEGDTIQTQLSNGSIESVVKTINEHEQN